MPSFSMKRGMRDPQTSQKELVNRSASGSLNVLINSSPLFQVRLPCTKRFDA